jgi:release factor glutamine methyltransferase
LQSDWCQQLPKQFYAAIISNPPYIAPDDSHLKKLSYEPYVALVADNDGLSDIITIATQAKQLLTTGGLLLFEHGYQQAEAVQELLNKLHYPKPQTVNDLAHLPRVTYAHIN